MRTLPYDSGTSRHEVCRLTMKPVGYLPNRGPMIRWAG
jgi:hypothetical protein